MVGDFVHLNECVLHKGGAARLRALPPACASTAGEWGEGGGILLQDLCSVELCC